ncbi:MAG: cytidyltransferase, partial [Clostridioides sp.]|nr:cytidyltransferase [Clostridioides sp.]
MLAKEVKEIRTKICRELKNFDYPNKTQSIYSMIDRFINSDELINNLEYIIEKSDFSARKTIEMSISFLEDISGDYKICNCDAEDKVDQYMKYLYNFALAKNFKKAVMVDLNHSFDAVCEVFYLIFQIICQYERKLDNFSMRGIYPLEFLTEGEISELENDEYIRFEKVFKKNYVYEMIKLSDEIFGFNTLDHICGVHYLALKLARQLKKKGILVDLGRVSGAAAGHDIGKYGCKGEELKRVPHLHYYYTDVWFKNNGINYIRNIAINHSTWDLEIENLSLESLILIYCDFRVKNKGKDMTIFSLEDSFRVILDKLENVDSKKEKRYKRVYAKLVDFEDYMIRLGVDIRVNTYVDYDEIDIPEKSFYSLLFGDDITEEMKYLAIEHNIKLMYHLRDEFTLENMLDQARTEKQWKNLRQYIRVLREYSTYFTPKQKLQTIKFLYENLYHIEDDIRRHSAELIGILIASYDEEYKKELPKDVAVNWKLKNSCSVFKNYLSLCLFPNVKIIPTHRAWIGYSSKIMVNALFKNCRRESRKRYREILMQYYNVDPESDIKMSIYLLEIAKVIPFSETDSEMDSLFYFLIGASVSKDFDLRVLALEVIGTTINKLPRSHYFAQTIKKYLQQYESYETPIERYAIYKINKY